MHNQTGRYSLKEQLGSTGLSTVYLGGLSTEPGDFVLKIFRPYLSSDRELMDTFAKNIAEVSRLDHPNILRVYGKEEDEGTHWLVMEYTSNPTLGQWLKGAIPAEHVLWILSQLIDALSFAQERGITHGDVKPNNIFIDKESGSIHLSDFKLSMLAEGAPPEIRASIRTPMPAFAAPERVQGGQATLESDIYSLGVLAYRMLTGSLPFNALDPATVLSRQLSSPPALPSRVNSLLSPSLDQIIIKALSPRPESRYHQYREFVEALGTVIKLPASFRFEDPYLSQHVAEREVVELPGAEGAVLICTVCGQISPAGATRCADCWSELERSGASADAQVVVSSERSRRRRRFDKIRKWVLILTFLVVGSYTVAQYLNIKPPLTVPSSNITAESNKGEWAMALHSMSGSSHIPMYINGFEGQNKWTFSTDAPLLSTPAIKNGVVYLTSQDGRVVALDESTGGIKWEHINAGGIESSPSLAGDMVFYGGKNSGVFALDAADGNEVWSFETGAPVVGDPIVNNGILYIGSGDNHLYALDALTGDSQWSYKTKAWISNSPVLAGNILTLSSIDGKVRMFDTDTGKLRFSYRGIGWPAYGSPIIDEDVAYVSFGDGTVVAVNNLEKEILFYSRYYRLKQQLYWWGITGHPGLPKGVEWASRVLGTPSTTATMDDEKLYIPTEEGRLFALDRSDGRRLWAYRSETLFLTSPTLVGNTLLMGDGVGNLIAVDSLTGKEEWRLNISTSPISKPIVAGQVIYVTSLDGNLYALE